AARDRRRGQRGGAAGAGGGAGRGPGRRGDARTRCCRGRGRRGAATRAGGEARASHRQLAGGARALRPQGDCPPRGAVARAAGDAAARLGPRAGGAEDLLRLLAVAPAARLSLLLRLEVLVALEEV